VKNTGATHDESVETNEKNTEEKADQEGLTARRRHKVNAFRVKILGQ